MLIVHPAFKKIPRWSRQITITEKIDGTNGILHINEDGTLQVGSRHRWITPETDNYGFARWAFERKNEIVTKLGFGTHYGEWWGKGIGKRYGDFAPKNKQFALFNVRRWKDQALPEDITTVPVLAEAPCASIHINNAIDSLRKNGSVVAPGCMKPEGIIIWHDASQSYFKKTLEGDESFKGKTEE